MDTLTILAAIAILTLPFTLLVVVSGHRKMLAQTLDHLEATQLYGGTPAALVKEERRMQFEAVQEQNQLERERVAALRGDGTGGVDPARILGG